LVPCLADVHYLMAAPRRLCVGVRASLPEEDPWRVRAQSQVSLLLVDEHVMQLRAWPTQGNDARFSCLCLVITKAYGAARQVHLIPLKLSDFTEPASGPVSKDEHGTLV